MQDRKQQGCTLRRFRGAVRFILGPSTRLVPFHALVLIALSFTSCLTPPFPPVAFAGVTSTFTMWCGLSPASSDASTSRATQRVVADGAAQSAALSGREGHIPAGWDAALPPIANRNMRNCRAD